MSSFARCRYPTTGSLTFWSVVKEMLCTHMRPRLIQNQTSYATDVLVHSQVSSVLQFALIVAGKRVRVLPFPSVGRGLD